jgi:acyl-coenzyme A thioesterase PaaI-like protein
MATPSTRIRNAWEKLSKIPGGKLVFSKMVGWSAPYTGTIDARVQEVSAGYARVAMRDRKAVRNHLRCIHAIALANLGEVTTGLATLTALPDGARGIPKSINVEYIKKARGNLTAECRVEVQDSVTENMELAVVADIKNASGEIVSRATAHWVVGPA